MLPMVAQKIVIKEIDYNNQSIEIQLGDIDLLEIVHSDEKKISMSLQDYAENPVDLNIASSDELILFTTSVITPIGEDLKINKFCYEQPLFPSYRLMIPQGCDITVTFKNGNFSTQNFTGNLILRLNTGDLTIDGFKGSINAELFSGNVDVTIKDTETAILSNHGKITTTFPVKKWRRTNISLEGTLGLKDNLLIVQSINGNILLNSSTTQ